jgi:hypothetical protein
LHVGVSHWRALLPPPLVYLLAAGQAPWPADVHQQWANSKLY